MENAGLICWENDYWASKMPLKMKMLLSVVLEGCFQRRDLYANIKIERKGMLR